MTFEDESGLAENTDAIESSSETPNESEGGEAKAAPQQKQESTPFHEHPRFKELVEQKNSALASQKAMEQKLAQLEQRFSQPTQPQAPSKEQTEFESLINDLKHIDPRLAAQLEAQSKAAKTVEELQRKLEGFEKSSSEEKRQAQVQTAVSKINQMHESNKLSPEARQLINNQMDLMYMQGKLNLQNLESEYKNALDGHNKFVETLKRAERESYVAEKKKDASVPTSQPKGAPAKQGAKKPTWSGDKEQAKQQVVARYLKQQAANREAGST